VERQSGFEVASDHTSDTSSIMVPGGGRLDHFRNQEVIGAVRPRNSPIDVSGRSLGGGGLITQKEVEEPETGKRISSKN